MNSTTRSEGLTLVLGGTGKTGRRVVERLAGRGVPTRVASRTGDPPFGWGDKSTWDAVLEGVTAAYISYAPDLAIPGAAAAIRAFAERAVAHGVRRLVLLSGRGEEEAQECELIIQRADIDWTVVRCSWFSQNFSEGEFLDMVLAGEIALPAGEVGEPFVDADDIADVAVAALTEDGHAGQVYELTGPRLLTFAGAFQQIDRAIINPWFFVSFFGALGFTALAAVLRLAADERSALLWIGGAFVLYLAVVVITLGINVPLNDEIKEAEEPDRIADLAAVRERFHEARWVGWNLFRAVASTVAFCCLAWALVLHGRQ